MGYTESKQRPGFYLLAIITIASIASFWKIFFIQDFIWDDNAWIQSIYSSDNLEQYLGTGAKQLRREYIGSIFYWMWWLHKNTDYFFPVLHTVTVLTQLGSALILYYLTKSLFRDQQLAFFVGLFFITFHLDQALPFATITNYRFGLLFALISLFLTVKGITSETNWRLMLLSGLSAVVAHSLFIEQAVAFEPGRLAVIAYCLYNRGIRGPALVQKTVTYWLPFLAFALPLIVYKLTTKPYGVYQGSYPLDPWFFLNWQQNLREIANLLLLDWLQFWKLSRYGDGPDSLLFFVGSILFFTYVLWRLKPVLAPHPRTTDMPPISASMIVVYGLGLMLLLPPLLMIKFAGLDLQLIGSQNSSHGILAQVGYAIVLGKIASQIFTSVCRKQPQQIWRFLPLACLLALGVYYNNVGLDLYRDSWQRQTQFWKIFVQRFTDLPERADFVIDAADGAPLSDLRIHFDFEVWLNMLYARSTDPTKFRRYRVLTMEDYRNQAKKRGVIQLDDSPLKRLTHWGEDVFDPRQLVVLVYRHGHMLVGPEIKQRVSNYHTLPYSNWLDHELPVASSTLHLQSYPLRHRMTGFNTRD